MDQIKVTFHPSGRSVAVVEGENLLQAAMEAGIHINASCGGSATFKISNILRGSA